MQVLEKILEEIKDNAKLGNMRWESIRIEKVEEIIRSHMDEMNDDWIPVEEGLPGDREEVEVTIEVADSAGGMRYYTKRAWIQDGRWIIRQNPYEPRVIAWQPLPEPYKPKKK
jgi:hypothetical protein|nr:MAG TPA: Protein of unknown function (DUF551) [Caudoviricetes sp.]